MALALVQLAFLGHRIRAFQFGQQAARVERRQAAPSVLRLLVQPAGQAVDVLAHVREDLADAVLELQLHERFPDLGLDAGAFALQQAGRLYQRVRHAAQ